MSQKNGTKKIKLQDYNKTRSINGNEVKCCNCQNTMAETYQKKIYYCFECDKNFCPMCKSLHKEHKNILDYELKHFRCPQHQGQNFVSYCITCHKNLCNLCILSMNHKNHNTINFINLLQEIN